MSPRGLALAAWHRLDRQPGRSPAPGPVPVPDLDHLHWVTGWPAVAHLYPGGGYAACTKATIFDPGHLASTDEVRRIGSRLASWCPEPACFPGRRCTVCHVPSGSHDECVDCLADSIAADKHIARTT